MTITVARHQLRHGPLSTSLDGVTIPGFSRSASEAEASRLFETLQGYAELGTPEPVVSTIEPAATGFYVIEDVERATVPGASKGRGFSIKARRVALGSPLIESRLDSGAERVGATSMASAANRDEWWALAAAGKLLNPLGTLTNRVGPGGTIATYVDTMTALNLYALAGTRLYHLAPASWYDMAATITDAGFVVVGRDVGLTIGNGFADGFEMINGLVGISWDAANERYNIRGRSSGSASAWQTTPSTAGYFTKLGVTTTGSNFTSIGPMVSARAMQTGPAAVVVVCRHVNASGVETRITWELRRGAMGASLYVTGSSAQRLAAKMHDVALSAVTVGGSSRGAEPTNTISSQKQCMFFGRSAWTISTHSVTNDMVSEDNPELRQCWYLGHEPASASGINTATEQGAQFYGAANEEIRVIRQ